VPFSMLCSPGSASVGSRARHLGFEYGRPHCQAAGTINARQLRFDTDTTAPGFMAIRYSVGWMGPTPPRPGESGVFMRSRWLISMLGVLAFLAMASSCANKKIASESTNDSLLATNPQETGNGNLSPQLKYQEPPRGQAKERRQARAPSPVAHGPLVPAGTGITVKLDTQISSETANVGDSWSGTVSHAVIVGDRVVIPAGSTVTGTVTGAKAAHKGDRAMLDLGMSRVAVNGHTYRVHGGTEAIIAGSPRARNLGAIAGGAAAGALIGKAVSGSRKGTLIGGLLGGAAAGGIVAKSKGYQVVLKAGTALTFTTTESVAMR